MLQALLKGKLTRDVEGMEDILTSNVFGIFKYIAPQEGLLPFLGKAVDLDGRRLVNELEPVERADYEFWPWMSEKDCYPAEPDVLITVTGATRGRAAILVEAKFGSGKSSKEDGSLMPFDQLAREYDNLTRWCQRKGIARRFLVYCTADLGMPRREMQESISEYRKKRGEPFPIFWLTWRCIPRLFAGTRNPMLGELGLLAKRLGLTFFEGFDTPDKDMDRLFEANPWTYYKKRSRYEWQTSPPLDHAFRYFGASNQGDSSDSALMEEFFATRRYVHIGKYHWPDPSGIVDGVKKWKWEKAKAPSRQSGSSRSS
jgi:hypothetical protein